MIHTVTNISICFSSYVTFLCTQGPSAAVPALFTNYGLFTNCDLSLNAGCPPDVRNDEGATPLHAAARNGQLKAVQVLLAAGADGTALDDDCCTALKLAQQFKHMQVWLGPHAYTHNYDDAPLQLYAWHFLQDQQWHDQLYFATMPA
jgi:ankyrin repeat protein